MARSQPRSSRRLSTGQETAIQSDQRVPVRTCVGCRRRRPRQELFRCVVVDDVVRLDPVGPGRGAWLCGPACIDEAARHRGFDRAFRRRIDPSRIEALRRSWVGGAGVSGSGTDPSVGAGPG
ncbi:MAG: YlxR family protein [Ilumatobacteraceae bacterium]